jgi:lantibiotic modifying enzyme
LLLPRLFEALKQIIEPTLVLELNVARVQQLLVGECPEERFTSFCERLTRSDVQQARQGVLGVVSVA